MEFKSIKDQNGKEHIVFKAQGFGNDESIGDKYEDFEILQKIGFGAFGEIYKVSSLINHKIYAMKILELKGEDEDIKLMEDYFISEIELLKKCDHPNIVKSYKSFREEDKIYIIMEYFDNGSLKDYIKTLIKKSKRNYKKEEIWNIFYQCISGLNYLHSNKVIHRDIKPENIFMTKNKIIKIGDFGTSAIIEGNINMEKVRKLGFTDIGTYYYKAPELFEEGKKYSSNIDIYSMGCVFYEICLLQKYQSENYINMKPGSPKTNVLPTDYDEDLMKIIKEMVNPDANKRPPSSIVLEKIKYNYNRFFIQNSGFYSVFRCMSKLPFLRKYFLYKFKQSSEKSKKIYSEKLLDFIEKDINWIENIAFYRQKIVEENKLLNKNTEINPSLIIYFVLKRIYGELKQEKIKNNKSMKIRGSLLDFVISNYFVGNMETIRNCCKCGLQTSLITYYFFLDLDLNLPLLKKRDKKEIDLIELFKMQNAITLDLKGLKKLMCSKCNKETKNIKEREHKESKIFYIFPNLLVISFDRGNNNENKIKINYPEKLDLSGIPKCEKNSPKFFNLVGVIKRCNIGIKEHYISIILNTNDNCWYLYDNEKNENINRQSGHKDGEIVMLFYESSELNNINIKNE